MIVCSWHLKGVPDWCVVRFFAPSCATCAAKLERGLCAITDPTPGELSRANIDALSAAHTRRAMRRFDGKKRRLNGRR